MTRFIFIAALFLGVASCGDAASNNDGSAQAQDAGYDGDSQD
jgi:hypothetical protein